MNIFHAQTNYKELYLETAFGKHITTLTGHRFFSEFWTRHKTGKHLGLENVVR